jgi:UPF0042 nucleotide-binding protein
VSPAARKAQPANASRFVVLTGLSGAGKSQALNALEDLGFFCVDNLPVGLLDTFLTLLERGSSENVSKVALVMDARERDFARRWPKVLESVAARGYRLEVVFLDATDASLIRRFSETRRRHPLAPEVEEGKRQRAGAHAGKGALVDAIHREREILGELRSRADLVVDTTELNVHQLRQIITRDFSARAGGRAGLSVNVLSFGFRYGPPREADLLIDVRFLPNPHFMPGLKEKSGLDAPVQSKVLRSKDGKEFLRRFGALLDFLIPRYRHEGKAYLTIGVGCTGGRHRSVSIAERIGRDLSKKGLDVSIVHRDLERSEGAHEAPLPPARARAAAKRDAPGRPRSCAARRARVRGLQSAKRIWRTRRNTRATRKRGAK